MSIIIRLQHLPWSADAADVRDFFRGLIIPEGGVHIVGGRDGDVFVQFSSDEDARLAMKNDGKRLKESKIKLLLSSQKEMQKVIEKARSDYAAGLVTPNFDSRASDDEEDNDKKRTGGRRSRSRSGSRERSHHAVQRNAPNSNSSSAPAIHQPTNFQAPASSTGVMAQFALPLQYQAPLQPQPPSMAVYGRQMGGLAGQVTMPLSAAPPLNMQQFAMTATHYLPPYKSLVAGDHDARVGLAPPPPFFNMFQPPPAGLRMPPADHVTQQMTTFQAPPPGTGMQVPPTFASVKSPEKPTPPAQHDRRDRGSLLPAPPSKMGSQTAMNMTTESPKHQSKILPPPSLLMNNVQAPAIADLTQMPLIKPPILPTDLGQQLAFNNNNNALNLQNMQNQFALGHLQNMLIDQQQQQQKPVIDRSMFREGVFMDNVIAAGARQDGSKNSLNQQIYEPDACICAENVPKDMLRYGTIRDFFAPLRLEGPDSIKLFDLGSPFGNVYCRFLTRQEAQLAIRLDGKKPGVRVRLCSDAEFDNVRDTTKAAAAVVSEFNPSPHFDSRIWHKDRLVGDQLGAPKNGLTSSYAPSDRRPEQQQQPQQQYHKQPLANNPPDRIVEISNLPYKTYDQAIWRFIEETRPKRLHRKLRLKDGKWLAFDVAFVEYYSIEDAESCFKFNGSKFDGRSLNVNWTSSSVLDDSTIRTYNGYAPPSSFNSRPSPDYSLGTAASRSDEKFQRRRSRSPPAASGRDRSRRRDKSRDRDRERSYEKDRDRDRRNRDRKRTRQSSKDRSSSRDKRRHTSRSPPSVVESSKASSSQTLSDVSPSPLTVAIAEPAEKDKKERRETIEKPTNIQSNPKAETKPTLIPETPEKETDLVVDNGNPSTMTCIFMSGLGPNVNVADIVNFFKSFKPVPAGVRLNLEPRGTAYVEFDTAAGCEQAFRCKNRHYIGVQMVTLRMCVKSEMTESVQKQHNLTPPSNGSSSTAIELSKNLQNVAAPTIQNKQQNDFNSAAKTHAQGTRASGIGLLGREPPNLARNEPSLAQHSHSNGNAATHNAPPPLLANRVLPPSSPPSMVGGGGGGQDVVPAAVASIDPAVVAALGPPGAVCFLHNLPPRITLEEICALFPFDARLIEDSVRMHYSHQTGEPTGDCLLAFQASQDAEKACRSINGRLISGRYLQMWIVPKSSK